MNRKFKLAATITLFVLTLPSLGFALLMSAAAGLASFGILADVSFEENRAMAKEAALYAGVSYAIGLVLLTCALLMLRAYQKHAK